MESGRSALVAGRSPPVGQVGLGLLLRGRIQDLPHGFLAEPGPFLDVDGAQAAFPEFAYALVAGFDAGPFGVGDAFSGGVEGAHEFVEGSEEGVSVGCGHVAIVQVRLALWPSQGWHTLGQLIAQSDLTAESDLAIIKV